MKSPVVLISGGSRGLGLAIVQDCLANGWRVATFSRSGSSKMEEISRQEPSRFMHFCGDASDAEFPRQAVRSVRQQFGRLDALVNNAAIAADGVLATMPTRRIVQLVNVNLTSVLLLSRECVREFLRAPRSAPKTIINISSIVGLTGFRGLSVYSSTKSALFGLTRTLARELGAANVTVNAVLPGFLATEMSHGLSDAQRVQIIRRTPLERLGEPKDVVPLIRFLLSEDSRFINGQCITIDGGATC